MKIQIGDLPDYIINQKKLKVEISLINPIFLLRIIEFIEFEKIVVQNLIDCYVDYGSKRKKIFFQKLTISKKYWLLIEEFIFELDKEPLLNTKCHIRNRNLKSLIG